MDRWNFKIEEKRLRRFFPRLRNLILKQQKRVKKNFSDIITTEHMLSLCKRDLSICLKNYNVDDIEMSQDEEMEDDEDQKPEPSKYDVVPSLPQTAEIIAQKGASSWIEISSGSEED